MKINCNWNKRLKLKIIPNMQYWDYPDLFNNNIYHCLGFTWLKYIIIISWRK